MKPHTTIYSPPYHSAFSTPRELVLFLHQMRELSGGKPVGMKLCIGRKSEFIGICKAMIELDIYPDFITVDGGEGGTGAAPQEFSNHVGAPLLDGLAFVHNMLVGFNIRHHIKIIASGKILSGFHLVRAIARGRRCLQQRARHDESARGMHTGAAVQLEQMSDRRSHTRTLLWRVGLGGRPNKKQRVANYHEDTLRTFVELMGAAGIDDYKKLTRSHIYRRVFMNEVRTFEDIFPSLEPSCMLNNKIPEKYKQDYEMAHADKWY